MIASKGLWRPFKKGAVTFPVELRAEHDRTKHVTMLSVADFVTLLEVEAIVGIGSRARVRYVQLCRPMDKITELRMKILDRPPSATPLHYRDQLGDTRSVLVIKRYVHGQFHKWDNSFSVAEMKRTPNEVHSEETRTRRADEKRF